VHRKAPFVILSFAVVLGGASAPIQRCTLGPTTYSIATTAAATTLTDVATGKKYAVPIGGVDAACIETKSGTMLGVLQRSATATTLAIVALPALQKIATLSAPRNAVRVADAVSGRTLDFREQIIHDLHFK
jgi:hypothetical protein